MKASFKSYSLNFKRPSGTSRGVLRQKESFFLKIEQADAPFPTGWGEVGVLRGLSADDVPNLEEQLAWTCDHIHLGLEELLAVNTSFPSIQFALEQSFSHLQHGFEHFESPLTSGEQSLPINGLIWMGDAAFMHEQIQARLSEGFKTLKMKVGAISWEQEWALLKGIRERFSSDQLELRVDANGAFDLKTALEVGRALESLQVHSIEQPLRADAWADLAVAAREMAVPIALDESLIGLFDSSTREELLDTVKPQYIILKPSFIGGWSGSNSWVELAEQRNIRWWSTSALESNVGLNAIAQWTATKGVQIPQGLGTGSLYTNNIAGPWRVHGGEFSLDGSLQSGWDMTAVEALF